MIYDSNGNALSVDKISPDDTTFMVLREREDKPSYTNLVDGNNIINVGKDLFNKGIPYGYAIQVNLDAGTYYLYYPVVLNKDAFSLYKHNDNDMYTLESIEFTKNNRFWDGSYDKYNNQVKLHYYIDEEKSYVFVEYQFTLSEGFDGYLRFGSGTNFSSLVELPQYVYLFSRAYNPFLDKIDNRRLFIGDQYAEGFVDELVETGKFGGGGNTFQTAGKTWYHIGDSNSQWFGGEHIDNDNDHGFLTDAARSVGISSLTNASQAGASWAYRGDAALDNKCGCKRIDDLLSSGVEPDYITFLLGTNADNAIGKFEFRDDKREATDNSKASDTDTTVGAIRYCLETILEAFPNAHVGVMLPMQRAETFMHQEQTNNIIKKLCDWYSVPTLDLFHCSGILPDSKLTAYDDGHTGVRYVDSAHVNAYGVEKIKRAITGWLPTI